MVKYCVAVLSACVVVAAACSSGSGDAAETTVAVSQTAASTLPAGEHTEVFEAVDALAAGSRGQTFTAVYDFYAPAIAGSDTGSLTVAQDLPQRAARFVDDTESRGVAFVGVDPDLTACGLTAGQWHCYSATGYFDRAPAVLDYGDLLAVFDTFRANQRWFAWTTAGREIGGHDADCAVGAATSPDAMDPDLQRRVGTAATLCVARTGVPLLVEFSRAEGSEILFRAEARSYRTDVASDAFEPPAPVEAGPPNVTIPVPQPPGSQGGGAGGQVN